jgi:hypothetical protein
MFDFHGRASVYPVPLSPDPLPNGPFFLVDNSDCTLRIDWIENQDVRDFSNPTDLNVIHLTIWRPVFQEEEE